jgi:pSer/pThr/pTyr-binding forkhead associated (FHA) protein
MMQLFGKLVLTLPGGQEQEFALAKANVTVGRATASDIILSDAKVSLNHARLKCDDEGCTLVDLGSKNGTRVNGVRVERAALVSGDVIALGDSTLRFEIAAPQIEPEATLIQSEADLEATLAQMTLSTMLSDTRRSRLAVHIPTKTWEVTLAQDTLTIGRHPESDLVLDHPRVSRHHARIERRGEVFIICDLNSKNGTWFGKQRVDEHTLQDSDTIRIGDTRLVFKRGFEPQDLTLVWSLRPGEKPARRPVVIVPGIMGSELWRGSERLWPNVRYLFTRPEVFCLPEDKPVEARGLVGEVVIVPNLL